MQFRVAFEHHFETPYSVHLFTTKYQRLLYNHFIFFIPVLEFSFSVVLSLKYLIEASCQSLVKVIVEIGKARHFSCVQIFHDTFWYCVTLLRAPSM